MQSNIGANTLCEFRLFLFAKPTANHLIGAALALFRLKFLEIYRKNKYAPLVEIDEKFEYVSQNRCFIFRGRTTAGGIGIICTFVNNGLITFIANKFGDDEMKIAMEKLSGVGNQYDLFDRVEFEPVDAQLFQEPRIVTLEKENATLKVKVADLEKENATLKATIETQAKQIAQLMAKLEEVVQAFEMYRQQHP